MTYQAKLHIGKAGKERIKKTRQRARRLGLSVEEIEPFLRAGGDARMDRNGGPIKLRRGTATRGVAGRWV